MVDTSRLAMYVETVTSKNVNLLAGIGIKWSVTVNVIVTGDVHGVELLSHNDVVLDHNCIAR